MTRLCMTLGACLLVAAMTSAPVAAQDAPAAQAKTAKAAKTTKPAKAAPTPASPLNLNTATQAQLETLPGIGAASAKRIIEFREKNGGFKKIEELMNVKGIGEKSFLKLKPVITVAAAAGPKQ